MADSPTLSPIDAELEALLTESLSAQAMAAQVKLDRKRLAEAADLTFVERQALRATILRWESENEWFPQMYVAVETNDLCDCGATTAHFLGLYELQQHRKDLTLRRFVLWEPQTLTGDAARLTRAYHTMSRRTPICPSCMWEKGFALRYEGDLKP